MQRRMSSSNAGPPPPPPTTDFPNRAPIEFLTMGSLARSFVPTTGASTMMTPNAADLDAARMSPYSSAILAQSEATSSSSSSSSSKPYSTSSASALPGLFAMGPGLTTTPLADGPTMTSFPAILPSYSPAPLLEQPLIPSSTSATSALSLLGLLNYGQLPEQYPLIPPLPGLEYIAEALKVLSYHATNASLALAALGSAQLYSSAPSSSSSSSSSLNHNPNPYGWIKTEERRAIAAARDQAIPLPMFGTEIIDLSSETPIEEPSSSACPNATAAAVERILAEITPSPNHRNYSAPRHQTPRRTGPYQAPVKSPPANDVFMQVDDKAEFNLVCQKTDTEIQDAIRQIAIEHAVTHDQLIFMTGATVSTILTLFKVRRGANLTPNNREKLCRWLFNVQSKPCLLERFLIDECQRHPTLAFLPPFPGDAKDYPFSPRQIEELERIYRRGPFLNRWNEYKAVRTVNEVPKRHGPEYRAELDSVHIWFAQRRAEDGYC